MPNRDSYRLPVRPRHGFTLIELLVVISIIALLIGLLMPALAGARRAAEAMQCKSNLRQYGIGVYSYANEHEDWIPPYTTSNDNRWFVMLGPYVTNNDDIRESPLWFCPSYQLQVNTHPYGMNGRFRLNYYGGRAGWRLDEITQQSTVLFGDMQEVVDIWYQFNNANPTSRQGASYRHDDRTNLVFLDGHAAAFEESEIGDDPENDRGDNWFAPDDRI